MVNLTLTPAVEVTKTCVRRRFRTSTCQACADVCPAQVFSITQSLVAVEALHCIGCGHCLFVCPSEAISGITPVKRHYRDDTLIAPFSAHAPTVNELLIWHRDYAIRFVAIEMSRSEEWIMAIANLNLTLRRCGEPEWAFKADDPKGINVSRRALFHVPRPQTEQRSVKPGIRSLRKDFPKASARQILLDLSGCQMCGACWRTCAVGAIRFENSELVLDSALCTGCEGCASACMHQALRIEKSAENSQVTHVSTHEKQCVSCHSHFKTVSSKESQCFLCKHHTHGMR